MTKPPRKTIHLLYFAILREERGKAEETIQTDAQTASQLYEQLQSLHEFTLNPKVLKVAINEEFQSWKTILKDQDTIAFIPPVAGG